MEWVVSSPECEGPRVITMQGDFDLYGAPGFFRAAKALLDASTQGVHLDFSGVGYLDSSGVGVIIRLLQSARAGRQRLTFSGIRGTPRKVLSMSNILPLLIETDTGRSM